MHLAQLDISPHNAYHLIGRLKVFANCNSNERYKIMYVEMNVVD